MHALATVPYLAELSQKDIKELAGAAQLLHLRKGELLFQEGAACKGLHVIVAGRMKVFKLSANGREQVLHAERDGALGEGPLLDGNPYPASAEAMETSVILFLPETRCLHGAGGSQISRSGWRVCWRGEFVASRPLPRSLRFAA